MASVDFGVVCVILSQLRSRRGMQERAWEVNEWRARNARRCFYVGDLLGWKTRFLEKSCDQEMGKRSKGKEGE